MDIKRIFEALHEWSRSLTQEQEVLLAQIMAARNSKGFAEIRAEDMRRIQEQIILMDDDRSRVFEVKNAANYLKAVASSEIFFI